MPLELRFADAITALAADDGRCWTIPVGPALLLRHWPRHLPGAAQLEQAIAEDQARACTSRWESDDQQVPGMGESGSRED